MSRTKDELLLACIKQFEHIEDVLGYNRLSTTRSLINEINQVLTIPAVVGQSEQLKTDLENEIFNNDKDWATNKVVGRSEQLVCPDCDGEGFSGKGTNEILPCLGCFGSGESEQLVCDCGNPNLTWYGYDDDKTYFCFECKKEVIN